jgi:ClpP class serine protease
MRAEQDQTQETRRRLLEQLEEILRRPVVLFYTSFRYPVMLDDTDAEMLDGLLQKMNLSKGLAVIINSPGGDGLAAERMINTFRRYSKTHEFIAVVPRQAKSAATLVCFGASKIIMGPSSELGPVDPQLTVLENKKWKRFSLCNVIESYDDLFARAVRTKGNLQPFLLQLPNYDEREIRDYRNVVSLATDIAVRNLASGMLKGKKVKDLANRLEPFLKPEAKLAHGRPIYREEAEDCGLKIEEPSDALWNVVSELHVRANNYVSNHVAKCIETVTYSFSATVPPFGGEDE